MEQALEKNFNLEHLQSQEKITDDYLFFSNSYYQSNSVQNKKIQNQVSGSYYEYFINDFELIDTKYSQEGSSDCKNKDGFSEFLEVYDEGKKVKRLCMKMMEKMQFIIGWVI